MKTGIELIAEERQEQIEKHGWSLQHDKYYGKKQLMQAARFCITAMSYIPAWYSHKPNSFWPVGWDLYWMKKVISKTDKQKLIVAGAFYMAEIDRVGKDMRCSAMIKSIAAEIDRLQNTQP